MKVGLVLEGGAMRGMFTAGVLDVFLDEQIHIDGIVSVSAGALFGVNLPSKQRGRVLRYNKKYLNDKRYMGWHSLFTTGNIVNKEFAFYQLPVELDVFDQEAFARSGIDFYTVLTNVESGEAEYVKIYDAFEQMETLRATSAMPFVSKMVEINGKKIFRRRHCRQYSVAFLSTVGLRQNHRRAHPPIGLPQNADQSTDF